METLLPVLYCYFTGKFVPVWEMLRAGTREVKESRERKEALQIHKMVTVEDAPLVSALPSKGLFHSILLARTHIKGSLSFGSVWVTSV